MGAIDVGGDGSVTWTVEVDRLRRDSAHSNATGGGQGHGNGKHHQDGIEDTTKDQTEFTITIKFPNGDQIYKLPIKDNEPDQIRIRW
jgi:hypothetical protein